MTLFEKVKGKPFCNNREPPRGVGSRDGFSTRAAATTGKVGQVEEA